jgi:hypothetical protein
MRSSKGSWRNGNEDLLEKELSMKNGKENRVDG